MSATVTETTSSTVRVIAMPSDKRMKVDGNDPAYGDWRDDLVRDGYAVVKGAIPRDRADKYADAMYGWLEGLFISPMCVPFSSAN
jgi:hypothetical protein